MKGDFSQWKLKRSNNRSVLHQQGKVFLDSDWNTQIRLQNYRQDQNAGDVIGRNIAAAPLSGPESFKIEDAFISGDTVIVTVHPGRVWADGLLTYLLKRETHPDDDLVHRIAHYLHPPFNDSTVTISSIEEGTKDAVVLEVWEEAVNGFQAPGKLLEPALGGVDTTERIITSFAFRLLRLEAGETCKNVKEKLKEDVSLKGRLKAVLMPAETIQGDCPLEQGGGYTGFEHLLYRIEIARVNEEWKTAHGAMFKWSRFNGGLVGRGTFENDKVFITDNFQAITTSGLPSFYLEALTYDPKDPSTPGLGHWKVIYGAEVALNSENQLEQASPPHFGTFPPADKPLFFRLWDGIKSISAFPVVSDPDQPVELEQGIFLEFDADNSTNYLDGDYWIFQVRAAGIKNKEVLLGREQNSAIIGVPPEGIIYHRVPLAIITWKPADDVISSLHDCRKILKPLTALESCCTFIVGEKGDFTTIQEAVDHIPGDTGGKICVLPGYYQENVSITGKRNLEITGCERGSLVVPGTGITEPVFSITGSESIRITHLGIETYNGTAVEITGTEQEMIPDIEVSGCRIIAFTCAIKVVHGKNIEIHNNRILMVDKAGGESGIFLLAEDSSIRDNDIGIIPAHTIPPRVTIDVDKDIPTLMNECEDPQNIYAARPRLMAWYKGLWIRLPAYYLDKNDFKARGGIHIGSASENIKIMHNRINGGKWNGISFGHIPFQAPEIVEQLTVTNTIYKVSSPVHQQFQKSFNSFIYNITIEGNDIRNMGLNGIGAEAYFHLDNIGLMVSIENITIYRNTIEHCLCQIPSTIEPSMNDQAGFGGICLPDCENGIIQENRIEHNGVSHIEPVCGIFILHGEKIDISHNRILNNGHRTGDSDDNARAGMRGGIVVALSFKKLTSEIIGNRGILIHDGIPSVRIQGNIVMQPFGEALSLIACGPVAVTGNQFTSQGVNKKDRSPLAAGSVFILNLGISKDLLGLLLPISFETLPYSMINVTGTTYPVTAPAPDSTLLLLSHLPRGTILYSNNQITLDLRSIEQVTVSRSQFIASLDDISYSCNQSECTSLLDFLFMNTILFGISVRTSDSRFQEGLTLALFSLFSFGIMNATSFNQATHCIYSLGLQGYTEKAGNIVLYRSVCEKYMPQLDARYKTEKE